MKTVKKIIAMLLAVLVTSAVCACHKKNEIAVSYGDYSATGAYYMCALINADMEARQKVDDALAEEEDEDEDADDTDSDSTEEEEEVDYLKQKVEDTDYSEWVKKTAMENVKKILFFKAKCEELELESTTDTSYVEQYASYYWSSYGYSSLYEPNGVNEDTFTQYMVDSNYEETYFESIYGEDGEKAPSKEELTAAAKEDYILVNKLSGSLTDSEGNELDDAAVEELRAKMQAYVDALNAGTRTYEEIYHEYNETDIADDTADETATDETATEETEEEITAVNNHAETMENTADDFETVNALEIGQAVLVETDSAIIVYQKLNIEEDYYYVNNMVTTLLHDMFDEEFDAAVETDLEKCDFVISDYAVNLFKVKNITYPESAS